MIKYVGEDEENLHEYVIQDKKGRIKCYSAYDPIIIRWEKFKDFYFNKSLEGKPRIRSVFIQYIPRYIPKD